MAKIEDRPIEPIVFAQQLILQNRINDLEYELDTLRYQPVPEPIKIETIKEKIVEIPVDRIVTKIEEKIVEVEKIVHVEVPKHIEIIKEKIIEIPVTKIIEKEIIKTKIPTWCFGIIGSQTVLLIIALLHWSK